MFCEDHFDEKYLRRQFNRTTLRKDAIPYPYEENKEIGDYEMLIGFLFLIIFIRNKFTSFSHTNDISSILECIEMAASDEDLDSVQTESVESSGQFVFSKPTSETKILNRNIMRQNNKNIEIDFIIFGEHGQEPIKLEESEQISREGESVQSASKNKRLRFESSINRPNESSQKELNEEMLTREADVPKKLGASMVKSSSDGIVSSSEIVDDNKEETYFALSLVGILKRLTPHKRAIAKCHILSYLTELEYGSNSL